MKYLLIFNIIFCISLHEEAYDIIKKMNNKDKPLYIKSTLKMETTKTSNNKKRTAIFKSWTIHNGEKQLIWFIEPNEYKGMAFLKQEKENFTDMRMWHPRYKKIRKITSSKKTDSFMNSELSFEDLYVRQIDDYTYSLLDSEIINKEACYVIESLLKIDTTNYLKHKTWISIKNLIPLKETSYNLEGKALKQKIFKYNQNHSLKSLKVVNLKNNNYTDLFIVELDTTSTIEESYFKEKSLRRIP
ncbi:MAG: hypothetical protein CMG00_05845 [Candidatus Marinimicrobia bacterium]|nr:hypothetical protein [Candidatus Neomarinimicrobiota bacterium]|tara:strand:+ start:1623 stop:2354 length:732 start_codon:yes stop_codon:yes gene_type:complete